MTGILELGSKSCFIFPCCARNEEIQQRNLSIIQMFCVVVVTIWCGVVGSGVVYGGQRGGHLGKLEDIFKGDNFLLAALGKYPLFVDIILLFRSYFDL